jgi:hypothetical protein
LCEGIGAIFLELQEVFDPEGDVPPVAPILSVDLCPDWALPWLAQFVGVSIPVGTDPANARQLIRAVSGFSRGTPAALRAAAGFALTGTKTVFFNERKDGNAYALQVATLTPETPDPDTVLALLLAQKPGGILLDYETVMGNSYARVEAEFEDYAEVESTYATYADLLADNRS